MRLHKSLGLHSLQPQFYGESFCPCLQRTHEFGQKLGGFSLLRRIWFRFLSFKEWIQGIHNLSVQFQGFHKIYLSFIQLSNSLFSFLDPITFKPYYSSKSERHVMYTFIRKII
ncbi:hypothetical protein FGO68_gene6966 [Halteria grandinella]|uniref:Uncharacterized protein n=1 Tax=Halteria grandinella TaxID=5974 RepID=A0A8J8NRJ4_HALGN|nr:hypothetical protein FGO68_gene6966 [Halteria grandinella]